MSKQQLGLFVLAALGLLFLFTFLTGVWHPKVEQEVQLFAAQETAPTVAAKVVHLDNLRQFSGQMQPRRQSYVSARITARVAEVLVEAGDEVEEGDVLLRLDNDDLSARVRQQQQVLMAAQARVNEARAHYQRVTTLVAQGLLPHASLDEAVMQRDTIEAEFIASREALAEAETSAAYSVILAPFRGVVSERAVFTGDIATPGATLIRLYQPESLHFEVAVSESVVRFIQLQQELQVEIDAQQQLFLGHITEIFPTADAASRSFKVRLALTGVTGTASNINPGMYGRLWVPVGQRKALIIPAQAVEKLGQLDFVQVLTQQGRERRFVRLGEPVQHQALNAGEVWLEVYAGLSANEQLVLPSHEESASAK